VSEVSRFRRTFGDSLFEARDDEGPIGGVERIRLTGQGRLERINHAQQNLRITAPGGKVRELADSDLKKI
jgi:hypothetical protein